MRTHTHVLVLRLVFAQELEKFKFVLDYKIKELKKQIEPREAEILEMKDQIKEVGSVARGINLCLPNCIKEL
eukprot:1140244-Pelagomonas_calceolata.AAC.7